MKQLFQFADDLGPEKVVGIYQPKLNLRAIRWSIMSLRDARARDRGDELSAFLRRPD
jgi:hypothetical protein